MAVHALVWGWSVWTKLYPCVEEARKGQKARVLTIVDDEAKTRSEIIKFGVQRYR